MPRSGTTTTTTTTAITTSSGLGGSGDDGTMRRLTAAVPLALVLLAGCSSGTDGDAAVEQTPSAPAPSPVTPSTEAGNTASATSTATAPSQAALDQLLTQAAAVSPALVADPAKLQQRAADVCQDVQEGRDDATIVSNAQQGFSDAGQLTQQQAEDLVDAIRGTVCG